MIFILEDNDERIENFKIVLGNIENHFEKTVPEAIAWLNINFKSVSLLSLDNDLYVPEYGSEEGEGWQLCEWLISNVDKRPLLIHTTNIIASDKMEMLCKSAGWNCLKVPPYNGCEWIHHSWIQAVRNEIRDFNIRKSEEIIRQYCNIERNLPKEFKDIDIYLYPILMRAVGNQATEGSATFSRYAIFIETIIGYIKRSIEMIKEDNDAEAIEVLMRACDALSAFAEIQIRVFDQLLKRD